MKNILILFAIMFTFSACKSNKDTMEQSNASIPDAKERGANMDGRELPNRPRRQPLDPEKLVAQLGLNEEQEAEFLELWNSNDAKMKALRENAKGDRMGMREGMKNLRDERQAGIDAILTDEQMAKLKEIMANRRRGNKKGGK